MQALCRGNSHMQPCNHSWWEAIHGLRPVLGGHCVLRRRIRDQQDHHRNSDHKNEANIHTNSALGHNNHDLDDADSYNDHDGCGEQSMVRTHPIGVDKHFANHGHGVSDYISLSFIYGYLA